MAREPLDIVYELGYDAAGAVSDSATLDMVNLRWSRAVLTLRRRAPDSLVITVPRAYGYSFSQFDAWRELRIRRAGAYWWGGFQGAMGAPGGEDADVMVLEAYGAAAALVQFWKDMPGQQTPTLNPSAWFVMTRTEAANASRADEVINDVLDIAIRGQTYAGTPWFKAADRTLATGTFTPQRLSFSGIGQLAIINQVCDSEGWQWRVGIASDGDFTFAAGGAVVSDLTDEIRLYSPANCVIESYDPDASILATTVRVATRQQTHETTLDNAPASGTATLQFAGNGQQFMEGGLIVIAPGESDEEFKEVDTITDERTIVLTSNLANTHTAGTVVMTDPTEPFLEEASATAKTTGDRHHHLRRAIYNDQVTSPDARAGLAETYLADIDDLVQSIPVRMKDIEYAEYMLDQGIRPGDTVSLTSDWLPFDDTDLVVQEIIAEIEPGGLVSMRLILGDPAQDTLSVVERMLAAARAAATSTPGV